MPKTKCSKHTRPLHFSHFMYWLLKSFYRRRSFCNQSIYACWNPSALMSHLMHDVEKSNKCKQCAYISGSRAGSFREHLKRHSREKANKCNQCDFASSLAVVLRYIWKRTVEKNQTNAASVIMHLLRQATWRTIWKNNMEFERICNIIIDETTFSIKPNTCPKQ